jgi:gamma-glutamyltranspeptidase/glutathione hydrolase
MFDPSADGPAAVDFDYPWTFGGRRSATMAPNGIVATSHPLAANAGLRVLESGGTAADAAVATAAVLGVVEPHMTGIGGDAFALVHDDGDYEALNASGPAPAAATLDAYAERGADSGIPSDGGLPVTVPGAVDGWRRLLARYGSRPLAALLDPAIRYAREGVPVTEYIAAQWQAAEPRLATVDRTAETFLPGGSAPRAGERFRNAALADSLELLADEGASALYGGDLGERAVETVRDHDGLLALSDLREYEAEWTEPISTTYRGVEVLEHPPNGQGAIALEALNIAEQLDVPADPTDPERFHLLAEATKCAFADGYEAIADPDVADVPTERLLSKPYATERAAEIGHEAADRPARIDAGDDTVYCSVVDADGQAVSFIQSNYMSFGAALTVGGFVLQNRGFAFETDPDHRNALEPGKRPFHTIIPAMLRDEDGFRASFGVMGGPMQPQGHVQVVSNLVDAGLNPQAAVDAPRYRYVEGGTLAVESDRLPEATVAALRERGHDVLGSDGFPLHDAAGFGGFGGAQVIWQGENGLIAGSEPRKDGHAVGY